MNCPNCGLDNPDTARFCSNCGTTLGPAPYSAPQYSAPQQTYPPGPMPVATGQRSVGQKIGLGCLIAVVIFFVFGISCTRACFRPRRYYRRYGSIIRIAPQYASLQQHLCAAGTFRGVPVRIVIGSQTV